MRTVSKQLLRFFLLALTFTLTSQTARSQPDTRTPTISVSGEAQIDVIPDKVAITLGVETMNADLKTAKAVNDASAARVLAVTQAFKVSPKDVQTDYISIEPQYSDRGHSIVGYTVRKSINITLRDVARFDALLSAAVDSGANVVLGVQFLTSDLRKYRDQARELAIKAAKQKADTLAGALGQKTGVAITISEQPESSWSYYNSRWDRSRNMQSQNVFQNADGGGDAGESTAPGQTQVRATVQVTFMLN